MKRLLHILLVLLFLLALSFTAFSLDSDIFNEQMEASGANDLWDTLSDKETDLLDKLGIKENDFDGVFNVSFRNIADFFYEIVRGEYDSVFDRLLLLLAVIVVIAAVNQFIPDDAKLTELLEFIGSVIAAVLVLTSLSSCITNAVASIHSSCSFITALVPVLAAIITVSGLPTLALTYNTLSFTVAQFVSHSGDSFVAPLIRIVLALSVVSTVNKTVNIGKFVDFIKKITVFIFSFMSTVFITMLSMKGMLAASADNVAVRGIRFLIGNMIPIVGGAVSDAYLSIVGTLNLVKNTVGVFAVAAVSAINLPVLIECVLWIFSLNLLGAVADVFSRNVLSQLFRSVSSALTLLSVSVLFEMLVFLLSLGLVLVVKGSV